MSLKQGVRMKIKILSLVTSTLTVNAYAYNDHASWSEGRGPYGGSYQYTTETQLWQSSAVLTSTDELGSETTTTTPYKGVGFRVSFGTELARFARFTTYSSYRDLTNSLTDSLRAYQVGGEGSLTFSGPVVNLQLGVGLFGSRQLQQKPGAGKTYAGTGTTALIGIEKFIASNASVIFSFRSQQESLKSDQKLSSDVLDVSSSGASFALALWM